MAVGRRNFGEGRPQCLRLELDRSAGGCENCTRMVEGAGLWLGRVQVADRNTDKASTKDFSFCRGRLAFSLPTCLKLPVCLVRVAGSQYVVKLGCHKVRHTIPTQELQGCTFEDQPKVVSTKAAILGHQKRWISTVFWSQWIWARGQFKQHENMTTETTTNTTKTNMYWAAK